MLTYGRKDFQDHTHALIMNIFPKRQKSHENLQKRPIF